VLFSFDGDTITNGLLECDIMYNYKLTKYFSILTLSPSQATVLTVKEHDDNAVLFILCVVR
jgi:hypothetical protein